MLRFEEALLSGIALLFPDSKVNIVGGFGLS